MPRGVFSFFFLPKCDMMYAKAIAVHIRKMTKGINIYKRKSIIQMNVITLITIYLAVINFISFTVMGIDKLKARKRAWRIPESTLFVLAIIGGSVGSIIGMHLFRHKTRHWYFLYGMPAILLIQILIVVALISSPIEFMIL